MLTCEMLFYLYSMYTYEEMLQIAETYSLPLDYMVRTCTALSA